MSNLPQSGKEVVNQFFDEIMNIEGTDPTIVTMLVSLHSESKLTDTNIQNALDKLLQDELGNSEVKDGKN